MDNARKEALRLMRAGYRRTSNKHRMVTRIDRKDWRMYMAKRHAPWDINEGVDWVCRLGSAASDHYLRCYSRDSIRVADDVFKHIESAVNKTTEYVDVHDFAERERKRKARENAKSAIEVSVLTSAAQDMRRQPPCLALYGEGNTPVLVIERSRKLAAETYYRCYRIDGQPFHGNTRGQKISDRQLKFLAPGESIKLTQKGEDA